MRPGGSSARRWMLPSLLLGVACGVLSALASEWVLVIVLPLGIGVAAFFKNLMRGVAVGSFILAAMLTYGIQGHLNMLPCACAGELLVGFVFGLGIQVGMRTRRCSRKLKWLRRVRRKPYDK
jgi:hypothetical protein